MKKIILAFIFLPLLAQAQVIETVAGNNIAGYTGDSGPATMAEMHYPRGMAVDTSGNLYIADASNNVIRKVSVAGIISTIAGNGTNGYSGDGGAATAAQLGNPGALVLDKLGNIYIPDAYNNVVRKINAAGLISTIAGNGFGAGSGAGGYSGDGGPATAAELWSPSSVAIDAGGNIVVADYKNNVVRKISTSGMISTIAGNAVAGYSGDGGAATAANLYFPSCVAFDKNNELYIADLYNNVVRKVSTSGIISTVIGSGYAAGTGSGGFSGDGGPATAAQLAHPFGLAIDTNNNIYFSDVSSFHVRKVDAAGIISTIAGNGTNGYSGDGGPAVAAQMSYPYGLALDTLGNLFIADAFNHVVRKVSGLRSLKTIAVVPARLDVQVYPNPACSILNITAQQIITTLSITNLSGAVMGVYQPQRKNAQINIAHLAAGEYILQMNGASVRKFIKE